MASVGPRYPGATLTQSVGSESANDWLTPANINSDDGSEAQITASTYDSPDISYQLVVYNHTFSVANGLPAGATIDGIVVEVDRRSIILNSGVDYRVQLTKNAGGSVVGDNKASATIWPTTSTVATYGGSTDKWGTTWTQAEVAANGFGVVLSAQANIANADIGVDFIRVTVYFTTGTAHTQPVNETASTVTDASVKAPRKAIAEATSTATDSAARTVAYVRTIADGIQGTDQLSSVGTDYPKLIVGDGPVLYYRTNETAGPTAIDVSGNARHGVYFDGSTFGAPGALANDTDTSYEGPGGEPGGITSPYTLQLNQAYTFEFWLYHDPDATTTAEHLSSDIAGTHVASPLQIVLSVVNGDPETLAFFPTSTPSLWTLAMNRGAYYHVVFTFDPAIDRVELFLNGVSRGQRTNADQLSEPGLYKIGQIFSGDHFWGRMDESALYDYVLTSAQVLEHYEVGTGQHFVADTIQGTDARSLKPGKAVADTAAGVDAITGKAIAKSIADAIQGTDSATPATGGGTAHDRDIDDAIQGVDAITGKAATKTVADAIQGTDARSLKPGKAVADAFQGTDASTRKPAKLIADAAMIADVLQGVEQNRHSLSDDIAATDSVRRHLAKALADAATATDASTRKPTKGVADTAAGTDASTRRLTKAIADVAVLTDDTDIAAEGQYEVDVDDTIQGTDASVRKPGKAVADTAAATDASSRAVVRPPQADTATVTDASSRKPTKAQADAFAGTDATARQVNYKRTVADGLAVTDGVSTSGTGALQLSLADAIQGTDAVARSAGYYRSTADTIQAADVHARAPGVRLADLLAGADALSRQLTLLRTISDLAYVTDAIDVLRPDWTYGGKVDPFDYSTDGDATYGGDGDFAYAGAAASTYGGDDDWTYSEEDSH